MVLTASCLKDARPPTGIAGVNAFGNDLGGCTATAPGPSSCPGVSVDIVPYFPGAAFGDFQSDPGTGQSHTITITFSVTVSSVTITAQDPTFAGNQMIAFDAGGAQVGQVSFAFNNTPGTNSPSTRTITASGIKSVQLLAASGDYLAYSGLSFTPAGPCPPVGESVVDDAAMRTAMRNALMNSGAFNNTPATRQELGGYVVRKTDGTLDLRLAPVDPLTTTPCANSPGAPQLQPGETPVAAFHTHPFAHFDVVPAVECKLPNPNLTHRYSSRAYGGGSIADWESTENNQIPTYVMDKNDMFRLDVGTAVNQRRNNPNRWRWNNPACTW